MEYPVLRRKRFLQRALSLWMFKIDREGSDIEKGTDRAIDE